MTESLLSSHWSQCFLIFLRTETSMLGTDFMTLWVMTVASVSAFTMTSSAA